MSDEPHAAIEQVKDHRFIVFVASSIVIAIILVTIAMGLYASSGASQLDLSRPGYAAIRNEIKDDPIFVGFPADGELDSKAFKEFGILYDEKMKEVLSVDAFGGDVLSPQSLQIDQKSALRTSQ